MRRLKNPSSYLWDDDEACFFRSFDIGIVIDIFYNKRNTIRQEYMRIGQEFSQQNKRNS